MMTADVLADHIYDPYMCKNHPGGGSQGFAQLDECLCQRWNGLFLPRGDIGYLSDHLRRGALPLL
eukprot:731892-Amphidinium_carterae.1